MSNSGRTEIDSVSCRVSLKTGTIDDARTRADASIPANESKSPNEYRVTLASLNPTEGFSVGLLTETPSEYDVPQISVRARGVVAEKTDPQTPRKGQEPLPFLISASAALLGVAASLLFLVGRRGRPGFPLGLGAVGPFDRNETLAYILSAVGLHDEAQTVRFAPSEISYMGSTDYIAGTAAKDSAKTNRCIVALKALMLVRGIAPESRRVLARNLRKLEGDSFNEAGLETAFSGDKLLAATEGGLRDSIDKLVGTLLPLSTTS